MVAWLCSYLPPSNLYAFAALQHCVREVTGGVRPRVQAGHCQRVAVSTRVRQIFLQFMCNTCSAGVRSSNLIGSATSSNRRVA